MRKEMLLRLKLPEGFSENDFYNQINFFVVSTQQLISLRHYLKIYLHISELSFVKLTYIPPKLHFKRNNKISRNYFKHPCKLEKEWYSWPLYMPFQSHRGASQ